MGVSEAQEHGRLPWVGGALRRYRGRSAGLLRAVQRVALQEGLTERQGALRSWERRTQRVLHRQDVVSS